MHYAYISCYYKNQSLDERTQKSKSITASYKAELILRAADALNFLQSNFANEAKKDNQPISTQSFNIQYKTTKTIELADEAEEI